MGDCPTVTASLFATHCIEVYLLALCGDGDAHCAVLDDALVERIALYILQVGSLAPPDQLGGGEIAGDEIGVEEEKPAHEQRVKEHEECKDCEHSELLVEALAVVLVLVQLHSAETLNKPRGTISRLARDWAVCSRVIRQKRRWLASPTQAPIQGQWWSYLRTHLPHRKQCLVLSFCLHLQMSQQSSSETNPSLQSSLRLTLCSGALYWQPGSLPVVAIMQVLVASRSTYIAMQMQLWLRTVWYWVRMQQNRVFMLKQNSCVVKAMFQAYCRVRFMRSGSRWALDQLLVPPSIVIITKYTQQISHALFNSMAMFYFDRRGFDNGINKYCSLQFYCMSNLTVDFNERMARQHRSREYRQQLDLPPEQKRQAKRLRSTENDERPYRSSRSKMVSEERVNGHFRQNNSSVLPTIGRKPPTYQNIEDDEHMATIDTELETIQYLNDCERIIQNLKKLTNISIQKLKSREREKSYEPGRKDRSQNSRQPTFFYPHQSRYSQKFQKNQLKNKTPQKTKINEFESPMVQKNAKNKSVHSTKTAKTVSCKSQMSENKRFHQASVDSTDETPKSHTQTVQRLVSPKVSQNKKEASQQNPQHESDMTEQILENKTKNEEKGLHAQSIENQLGQGLQSCQDRYKSIKVDQKKQKILFRYLGKAKSRGAQLYSKIADYRLKNKDRSTVNPGASPNEEGKVQQEQTQAAQYTLPMTTSQKELDMKKEVALIEPRDAVVKNTAKFICKEVDIKIESLVSVQNGIREPKPMLQQKQHSESP